VKPPIFVPPPAKSNEIQFHTSQIRFLRAWLARNSQLVTSIGQFAQFRLVVDANIVIQELVQRVRFPERGTALEELIRATIVVLHAPRWLATEMESAIPQVASKRKLSEEKLRACWQDFQVLLTWDETWLLPPEGSGAIDEKDLPYVLLEKAIAADGILSKDRHIERMGGNRLTLDFVFAARQYARASVVTVSIHFCGHAIGAVALRTAIGLSKTVLDLAARLPPRWKLILLVAAVVALIHPATGAWIGQRLRSMGPALEQIALAAMKAAEAARTKAAEAKLHLSQLESAMNR
jgi:predicted nucleic acid-binding protein